MCSWTRELTATRPTLRSYHRWVPGSDDLQRQSLLFVISKVFLAPFRSSESAETQLYAETIMKGREEKGEEIQQSMVMHALWWASCWDRERQLNYFLIKLWSVIVKVLDTEWTLTWVDIDMTGLETDGKCHLSRCQNISAGNVMPDDRASWLAGMLGMVKSC